MLAYDAQITALVGANGMPVTPLDTQLVGGTLPGQPQMLAGPSEMDQRLDIARIEVPALGTAAEIALESDMTDGD